MASSLWLIAFGFVLLVLQSSVAMLVPIDAVTPNLVLPIVVLLGVSPEVHVVRGAIVGFVLGYLLDSNCGSPMGLHTFVMTATFLVSRGAGLRLFPQGTAFQVLLTFLMTIVFGATVIGLRAIFEPAGATMGASDARETALVLIGPAVTTALASPFVFAVTRRIEALSVLRREERKVSH
jgi:rod shape-determining protein MreD